MISAGTSSISPVLRVAAASAPSAPAQAQRPWRADQNTPDRQRHVERVGVDRREEERHRRERGDDHREPRDVRAPRARAEQAGARARARASSGGGSRTARARTRTATISTPPAISGSPLQPERAHRERVQREVRRPRGRERAEVGAVAVAARSPGTRRSPSAPRARRAGRASRPKPPVMPGGSKALRGGAEAERQAAPTPADDTSRRELHSARQLSRTAVMRAGRRAAAQSDAASRPAAPRGDAGLRARAAARSRARELPARRSRDSSRLTPSVEARGTLTGGKPQPRHGNLEAPEMSRQARKRRRRRGGARAGRVLLIGGTCSPRRW